ncbi:hypothetical protein Rsub_08251 [Raphidocelis subcapitata]|uniref:Phosphatase 2C containing protein n=1 Tax=Raphidocelis subcapitata TaxID=307507 RepID=A0A2V0NTX9_9CHLO|nr:phosphatase 2C containing protein [Raphidocelis subcapitata]GBF95815.1 hypothetical protein Rsub_08251 [Raphidocelis subcapitata]|eukprot:GBF88377.1 phosphatase 2C containing protein [Raphidocelis subcapitata]
MSDPRRDQSRARLVLQRPRSGSVRARRLFTTTAAGGDTPDASSQGGGSSPSCGGNSGPEGSSGRLNNGEHLSRSSRDSVSGSSNVAAGQSPYGRGGGGGGGGGGSGGGGSGGGTPASAGGTAPGHCGVFSGHTGALPLLGAPTPMWGAPVSADRPYVILTGGGGAIGPAVGSSAAGGSLGEQQQQQPYRTPQHQQLCSSDSLEPSSSQLSSQLSGSCALLSSNLSSQLSGPQLSSHLSTQLSGPQLSSNLTSQLSIGGATTPPSSRSGTFARGGSFAGAPSIGGSFARGGSFAGAPGRVAGLAVAYATQAGCDPGCESKANQDACFAIECMPLDGSALFGVLDGHGPLGHVASAYVRRQLPPLFAARLAYGAAPGEALAGAFLDADAQLGLRVSTDFTGTTAVVAHLLGGVLTTAWVGDSRAVLGRRMPRGGWKAVELTRDHKPDAPKEKARIERCNGRVERLRDANGQPTGPPRVWLSNAWVPGLAMSRALGDRLAHKAGVTSEPDVTRHALAPPDRFLILATDGVWEFVTSQDAVELVARAGGAEAGCKQLVREAMRRWLGEESGASDDITAVVVWLPPQAGSGGSDPKSGGAEEP